MPASFLRVFFTHTRTGISEQGEVAAILRLCLKKSKYFNFTTEHQEIRKMELTKLLSPEHQCSRPWPPLPRKRSGAVEPEGGGGPCTPPTTSALGGALRCFSVPPNRSPRTQDLAAQTQGEEGGHSWRPGASSSPTWESAWKPKTWSPHELFL